MPKTFDENDVFIVAQLKDKPVYVGDIFSPVDFDRKRQVEEVQHDDLTIHFIKNASGGVLEALRERRDEINQDGLSEAETIKIFAEPEIDACEAIFISSDGDVELIYDQELTR